MPRDPIMPMPADCFGHRRVQIDIADDGTYTLNGNWCALSECKKLVQDMPSEDLKPMLEVDMLDNLDDFVDWYIDDLEPLIDD